MVNGVQGDKGVGGPRHNRDIIAKVITYFLLTEKQTVQFKIMVWLENYPCTMTYYRNPTFCD